MEDEKYLGLGVMINTIFGDNGDDIFAKAIGKTIAEISLRDLVLWSDWKDFR